MATSAPRIAPSEAYGSQAGHYEQRTGAFRYWRELLVGKLPARRGDTVLDVGCGTGLCLPLLQRKVGASGMIVGIDESEQMLRVAAERVAEHGWDNVRLLAAPVAGAPIERTADAALFCAVHDVLQSPAALDHILAHLHPGAPVVRPAGNGQPHGCGRCRHGWPPCTRRSSTTSPASTGPGGYWLSWSPTCGSTSWPSALDTSRSATPGAADTGVSVQGTDQNTTLPEMARPRRRGDRTEHPSRAAGRVQQPDHAGGYGELTGKEQRADRVQHLTEQVSGAGAQGDGPQ